MATVNRKKGVTTIYAKHNGSFNIPVVAFPCSVGKKSTPSPVGSFYTSDKYRWRQMITGVYAQYATRIVGGVLFHAVPGGAMNSYSMGAKGYNSLGYPGSLGCIRLRAGDAKWVYDKCARGMNVKINDYAYQPFDKPWIKKIPESQTWDPTDPNVR